MFYRNNGTKGADYATDVKSGNGTQTSKAQLPYNAETGNISHSDGVSQDFATMRSSFSKDGQAAFDIAMESATDKQAAANQFRIKYLEGERGAEFNVDEGSELTPQCRCYLLMSLSFKR